MGRQRQARKTSLRVQCFLGYRNDVAGVTGSAQKSEPAPSVRQREFFYRKQLHAGDEIQAAGEARKSNSGGDPGRGPAGASRPEDMEKAKRVGDERSIFSGVEGSGKYSDTKFFTAKQKERAYRCFARVLRERDISKMDKNLYEHLIQHCGFIAHYSIHGFKAEYSGRNFRRFVERFDRNSRVFAGWNHWVGGEYADVNNDMVDLATAMAPQIYAELDVAEKVAEIRLCKAIAEKYGLKVVTL